MRVFVTGATGFIGSAVAQQLRGRGDSVRTLVRDPAKGVALRALGCELIDGGLGDASALRAGMDGCDAVIHGAAIYEIGIPASDRPAMYEANVTGTERVIDAALDAGVSRMLYISTIAALGNTRGQVVDEAHQHSGRYTSYYDETKHLAHQAVRRAIDERGLPCIIVQPGGVYGPDDHSQLGNMVDMFLRGRMPMMMFPEVGLNFVHRDDVASGVLLALDQGLPGEAYVLGGHIGTMRDFIGTLATVTGRRPPRWTLPSRLIKLAAPLGPLAGPMMGFPPNLRELISSSDGVTFWAKDDKARRELGYAPRPLEQGLRDTLNAEGRL